MSRHGLQSRPTCVGTDVLAWTVRPCYYVVLVRSYVGRVCHRIVTSNLRRYRLVKAGSRRDRTSIIQPTGQLRLPEVLQIIEEIIGLTKQKSFEKLGTKNAQTLHASLLYQVLASIETDVLSTFCQFEMHP